MRSLRRSPTKHIDLLPQDQVFRFQRCSRLEARSQDIENQLEQIGHQERAYAVRLLRLRRIEFSVHTGDHLATRAWCHLQNGGLEKQR